MAGNLKSHPSILGLFASRVKLEKRSSGDFWGLCPVHPEKTPSFHVQLSENGWFAHCFGCGWSGDPISFIQEVDKVSFKQAKEIIEKATGGNWDEAKKKSDEVFQKLETSELKPATRYSLSDYVKFEIALYESSEAKEYLFRERGILYDTARKLHFGYCQNISQLNKKYSPELEEVSNDGWILMPAIENNEIIAIEARSIKKKVFSRKAGMESKVLWGLDSITFDRPVYVVEGKYDQAVFLQAGYTCVSLPNSTANISPSMRDKLMQAESIVLAGDEDSVGTSRMDKLWAELAERTYRLHWPKKCKDANQTFLEYCERSVDKFQAYVEEATLQAFSNPMPGIKSIQDVLLNDESISVDEREDRLKFSIPAVDKMFNAFPGSVIYISATYTGSGKSTLVVQETLNAARNQGLTVLNYQTQLQGHEVGNMITAQLLAKDRNELGPNDRKEAAKRLRGVEYYIGHDPTLTDSNKVLDLIEAGIRRVGANIVVLDLIHDIFGSDRELTRAQEQAMRRIKTMAQKYLCVWILIGQPKKVDSKQSGKPLDIYASKGSESLPSESDAVLYLHRDRVKNMTEDVEDSLSPEVQIHCLKARSKGKGKAFTKVFFLGKIATFREITPIEEPIPEHQSEFNYGDYV